VVALVGDEATVKTLKTRRGKIVLQPENDAFDEMVFEPDEVQILGRVIEVRRYID
jgi:repressor LexA